ncbi:MAG: hypothetical protein JNN26_23055 [Candidatus Obscuribacter sp.]|nr:hypothetical protein [Candidatus Obscuribacter sp.]
MNENLDHQGNSRIAVSPESVAASGRNYYQENGEPGNLQSTEAFSSAQADANTRFADEVYFSPRTYGGYPRRGNSYDQGFYPNHAPSYESAPNRYHGYPNNAPAYEGYPHSAGSSGGGAGSRSQESGIAPVQQDGYEYQSVVPSYSAAGTGNASSGRQSDAGSQSFAPMPPQSGSASGWSEYSGAVMHSSGPVEGAPTVTPGFEMRSLIARNPERMDLATDIVNDIISGGTAAAYKEKISDLSAGERLDLARDLHATVADYNQQLGLTPGLDKAALVVDVRVGRNDEYVNDIDILRGSSSAAEPERVMERIDLYDPGFWTGVRSEGREVDQKQALDAVTAPYEMLARASLQATEAVNKRNPGDTVALREARERSLEGHDDYAVEKMLKDQYYSVSDLDDRAEQLAENLKLNFANPSSLLLTENTRPLFAESSMTARNELRPSREVKELTDSFRTISKW